MLIVIGGLPATGKTTLARLLAAQIGGVHLRIDTIEQAIVRSGLAHHPIGPAGYVVGYALAEEYLHQGLTVIAESVNPLAVTRNSWRDVGVKAAVPVAEVEVICSAPAEHRRRATSRSVDVPDLPLPDWQQILDRDYEPWDRERIVIDTAQQDPQQSLAVLLRSLDDLRPTPHNPPPA
ncbi:AAA family ATPase [Streptomyces sp. NPDC050085]|uniref:AAA family ATPase n=1 Tax=Streptomyces sp. NPDC050085 TaxID=3365600 RepID=UPI0037B4CD5A